MARISRGVSDVVPSHVGAIQRKQTEKIPRKEGKKMKAACVGFAIIWDACLSLFSIRGEKKKDCARVFFSFFVCFFMRAFGSIGDPLLSVQAL